MLNSFSKLYVIIFALCTWKLFIIFNLRLKVTEFQLIICCIARNLSLARSGRHLMKMDVLITSFPTYRHPSSYYTIRSYFPPSVSGFGFVGQFVCTGISVQSTVDASVHLLSDFENMKSIFSFVLPLSNRTDNWIIWLAV